MARKCDDTIPVRLEREKKKLKCQANYSRYTLRLHFSVVQKVEDTLYQEKSDMTQIIKKNNYNTHKRVNENYFCIDYQSLNHRLKFY